MTAQLVPIHRALLWILLSVLLVSGSATAAWFYYLHVRHGLISDKAYNIVAIVQRGPHRDGLKTVYLAELMGLSVDQPTNLFLYSTKEAENSLLQSPLIKSAKVKKIKPGTLLVEYVMRYPIAYLSDFSDLSIDKEGFPIPFKPFFTPKKLPEIYLGLTQSEVRWNVPIENRELQLAFSVLNTWKDIMERGNEKNFDEEAEVRRIFLKRIDASRATAESYGQRQVILTVEEFSDDPLLSRVLFLRLNVENYREGIAEYKVLRSRFKGSSFSSINGSMVIDFRLPKLGFITKLEGARS